MTPISEILANHGKGVGAQSPAAGFVEVREIWQAYPEHRRSSWRPSQVAITEAIEILTARGQADPAGWLLGRVRAYAASPEGRPGGYTKSSAKWFSEGKYDDPPEAWERPGGDAAPTEADTNAILDRVMGAKS